MSGFCGSWQEQSQDVVWDVGSDPRSCLLLGGSERGEGELVFLRKKTSGIGQPGHMNQYGFHNYKRDPAASIETHEYARSLQKSEGIWEEPGASMGDLTGQSVQLLQGKRLPDGRLENRNPSRIGIENWGYMAPIKKETTPQVTTQRRNPARKILRQ